MENYDLLLDQTTPFNETKLELLDCLVQTFYKTTNENQRKYVEKYMSEFKNLETSWLCIDLCFSKSKSPLTLVFSLGIMEDLIKTKWSVVNPDQRLGIRNFLVDQLLKFVSNEETYEKEKFLISKLNQVIVHIAKQELTTTWTTFISEICNSSQSDKNICENNLKILLLLNEEIFTFWKNSLTSSKMHELKQVFEKEYESIFNLCMLVFNNSQNVPRSLLKNAVRLYAESVKWFPLDYVFKEDILSRFLNDLQAMPAIRLDIMKCLSEICIEINIVSIPIDINITGPESFITIKNFLIQLFKSYINTMQQITNNSNFYTEYIKLKDNQKMNFEEFSMQFALSLISFFKNNIGFIEEFDFILGSASENEFISSYMNEIYLGLCYIAQIHQIPENEELFKSACEFWNWFILKIIFIKEKQFDPDMGLPNTIDNNSLIDYLNYAKNTHFYAYCYSKIFEQVRYTLIIRMIKPMEIKIDIDECGEVILNSAGSAYQSLHEIMRDSLIFLTHLEPSVTESIMIEIMHTQTDEAQWNPSRLNSVSWAVGCISGSMEEIQEKKFLVQVIKYLLNLCDIKRGKSNKAVCASNIMYVVGQYPRFLNSHWKFLKTVVKKLFEFMHELHPGVQDFACETFMKISLKCSDQFIIVNETESEPYINVLVRSIKDDTQDLQPHQKLMFYEAIGNIIGREPDFKKQVQLVSQMMSSTYNEWISLFDKARVDASVLQNQNFIKTIDLIIRLNEKAALSVKTNYYNFGCFILPNIIQTYEYYNRFLNDWITSNNKLMHPQMFHFKSIKKTILKFIITLISNNEDKERILKEILPILANLIEEYRIAHDENKDADVLLVFSAVLDKIKNSQYEYISSIWNYLCLYTLDMIKTDFHSYPEHRMNFFKLVKSLIINAFDALFQIQDSEFNNKVLNAIIWAARHEQLLISETGLETLLILIKNLNGIKISNGINICDPFYRTYYFQLIQELFVILTDSFHKSGFSLQIEIIHNLIISVEFELVSQNLFDSNNSNKDVVINSLYNMLSGAFTHLSKVLIETFCFSLFNKCYSLPEFRMLIRDFLINLKSFSSTDESLYELEKKVQLEELKLIEDRKRNFIPGMQPLYDKDVMTKINSFNYGGSGGGENN